jgi:hypothetical protein
MRTRLIGLAAAAGLAVATLPAHAASAPKPQITDPAGDANGLNDQGAGTPLPSVSTPVDDAAADITGITLQTVFVTKKVKHKTVKKPVGSTITVSFSGALDTNTFYAVSFTSAGTSCKSVNLVYDTSSVPLYAQNRGICEDTTTGSTIAGPQAKVSGSNLVWSLPLSAFPVNTTLSNIGAQTLTGAVPLLVLDQTAPSKVTFKVGQ